MIKVSKQHFFDFLSNYQPSLPKVSVSDKWPHSICWKDRDSGKVIAMEVPNGNKYDYYINKPYKMTEKQFDIHVDERIEKIIEVLQIKAKEYRKNDNPFHNFDRAAAMNDCTPERALMGMLAKHQISVLDLVDDIDRGNIPSRELTEEMIGDHINYLILLEGLIYRRLNEDSTTLMVDDLNSGTITIESDCNRGSFSITNE